MSSAEAVARHHLYTLNYLPKLLGIARPEVDFEPDTFGHHRNTPELLSQAGVKYPDSWMLSMESKGISSKARAMGG